MGLRVPGHPPVMAPVPTGLPPRRFPKSPYSHNTDALLSAATQDLPGVLGAVFQRETHGQLCAPSYKSQCRARLRSRAWSRGGDVPAREAPGGSEGGCGSSSPALRPRPLRVRTVQRGRETGQGVPGAEEALGSRPRPRR